MSNVAFDAEGAGIRARLESLPLSTWHAAVFVICSLTLLCDSADSYMMISIGPVLIRDWKITTVDLGFIASATGIGGMIGAPVFGYLADQIGRRKCMAVCLLLYSILTGVAALAENTTQLVLLRGLAGIGLGGMLPVTLAYVGEYSPQKWRGRMIAWWNSMYAFGIALSGVVGVWIIVPYGWRWGFVAGAVPVIFVPCLFMLPESVRFFLMQGRYADARQTLLRVERAVLGAEKASRIATPAATDPDLAVPSKALPKLSTWAALSAMNKPGIRAAMLVCAALWFIPSAISLAQFYGVFLTQYKGMDLKTAIAIVTATSAFGPLGQITAGILSDWAGRKVTATIALLLVATMPLMTFMVATSAAATYFCLALIWIAIAANFGVAFGYTTEQLPTELRGSGLGVFEGLRRVANAIAPVFVGLMVASFSLTPVLWIVFAGGMFCLIVVLIFGRETRGKPMLEREQLLSEAGPAAPVTATSKAFDAASR